MSNQGESTSNSFNAECSSVQTHVQIMQAVIRRMAKNSSACKLQCIVTVATSLILVAQIERPEYIWITLLLTFIFLILDIRYLTLEQRFRDSYKSFVKKLAKGRLTRCDLYIVKPSSKPRTCFRSLGSFSIWLFYGAIFIMILVAWYLIYAADPGEVYQPFRNKWGMEGWNKWGGTAGSGCGPHITGR